MLRVYWLGLHKQVEQFCWSCAECQWYSNWMLPSSPPSPVTAFDNHDMTMDVISSFPQSIASYQFILVLVTYAPHYPDAVPMKVLTVPKVAEELVMRITWVDIPQEILSDQGTNFMSQVIKGIFKIFKIQHLRMLVCHSQTDGLVKRFNWTLKVMIRKSIQGDTKRWELCLPCFMFAIWEVPQVSLSCFPFKLT